MIPIELDHREDHADGLRLWITTTDVRPITLRDLEDSFEAGWPNMFTRQFEVGPEDMFRS